MTGTAQLNGAGVSENATFLLLLTGTLVGFSFPLGKIAGTAGISPMMWAMIFSFGASAMVFPVLVFQRRLAVPRGRMARYVILSALISYVIPNLLLFSVIPKAGAGYAGLMFALSPVFTLALAVVFRMKTPSGLGMTGIATGLIGAAVVSVTRSGAPGSPDLIWIGAAILVPLVLACGNIYRTLDWPDEASPDALAFWSHGVAVTVFLVLLMVTRGSIALGELALSPAAAVAQMVVAGLTFPAFFRLQRTGGPVLLSQLGYVAAAVGMLAATLLLDEHYAFMTWAGAAVIAMGIAITIAAQRPSRSG